MQANGNWTAAGSTSMPPSGIVRLSQLPQRWDVRQASSAIASRTKTDKLVDSMKYGRDAVDEGADRERACPTASGGRGSGTRRIDARTTSEDRTVSMFGTGIVTEL